jgi:hypothetical protein
MHLDGAFIVPADEAQPWKSIKPASGDFSLAEIYQHIGDPIQVVRMSSDTLMLVNDEGRLKGLPLNIRASALYQMIHPDPHCSDVIVGDVILCPSSMLR